jgi:hypothetical protein
LIKLLQADNFFRSEDIEKLFFAVRNLQFVEKEHGFEIDQFNLVVPGLDPIFSKLLAEEVTVDEDNSGIFRKPNLRIHFEGFEDLQSWIFIIALESTTFNLYHHLSNGPGSEIDARTALDSYKFSYNNMLEWDYHTHILLEPNQGVIFRPWLFHSLTHERLIQIYRLKGKTP